jgi:hypothetical protein
VEPAVPQSCHHALPELRHRRKCLAPQADISWCVGPSRESEFVKFPNRFMTEADAVACALRSGEAWIDNRLGRLRSGKGSEHARMIDMIGALKKSLGKSSPTQPPRSQGSIQWHAQKTFTFGQFKSAIAKSGVKLSEQTLQKSYAALVKLTNTTTGRGLRRDGQWNTLSKITVRPNHRRDNRERGFPSPSVIGAGSTESPRPNDG